MDFSAWMETARSYLPGFTVTGLSTEFTMLGFAVVLGLLQLLLAARTNNGQRGIQWNVGPRDGTPPPVSAIAGRLERAYRNFMETFPFFAVAILATNATNRFSLLTQIGSQVYVMARVLYVPLYAGGVPVFRTLVWLIGTIGLALVIAALFISPGP